MITSESTGPGFSRGFPILSDLERSVVTYSDGERGELLEKADFGDRVHGSVSLFVGNYTLGASSNFGYALENDRKVNSHDVNSLKKKAWAIRHNGEENSEYTLGRCHAADELYGILKKAEREGHLDDAAKVIGYLDRGSSVLRGIFSGFGFFYDHDSEENHPRGTLNIYGSDRTKFRSLTFTGKRAFESLPDDVSELLIMWVGRYGHEALEGITRETIHFKDNKPDRVTRERVLADIPAVQGPVNSFYKSFGEDLLKGYGLMEGS